jgi:hypothetical protein
MLVSPLIRFVFIAHYHQLYFIISTGKIVDAVLLCAGY